MRESGFSQPETFVAQHTSRRWPASEVLASGRLAKHSTSQLIILSDDEYADGIARIEREAEEARLRGETLILVSDLHLFGTRATCSV